ncbi:MAG: nucleotidyl transferase AbiEii/AbiGii toxin family protein [Planctomycetales bacterium]|jgi:predicted nucleotidyltransferase
MNLVYDALDRMIQCLSDCEVRFALIGGLAVSARSEPRFTRDVDLIVDTPTDADAEQLIRALLGKGYGLHAQLEQKSVNRLATCRLLQRDQSDGVIVDLFFANFGIEQEVLETASEEQLTDEISLPIVQAEDLIALKLLAVSNRNRPRDSEDILNLLEHVSAARLERTRKLLRLMAERRPVSAQNLEQLLDELIEVADESDSDFYG